MADVELTWTVPGQSHADLTLSYDPGAVDANGNVVVSAASGTYQKLNADGSVASTDQVTGLIAPNSFLFAPDDQLNINGKNPAVDTAGVGVIINNPADADQIGPNNTPEVVLSTDIFGDYRELQKGGAQDVGIQQIGGNGGATGSGNSGGVEVFVFNPNPSLRNIAHVLGTPQGLNAIGLITEEFSSLAQLIHHSNPSPNGSSTIVHLPSQQTEIVLKNLTEGEIRADAGFLAHHIF